VVAAASLTRAEFKALERLNTRYEFLIASHHPLREILMQQTSATTTRYAVAIDQQGDKQLDSGGLFA
jgi:hypothetical protein